MRIIKALRSLGVLIPAFAAPLCAQRVGGALAITGGSATDVVGTSSRAATVAPSVWIMPDPRIRLGLDASATRFDNAGWSLSAGPSAAARLPLGAHGAVTVNAAAATTGTSYDFSYQTLNAIPAIEATAGAFTAYVGAEGSAALTHIARDVPIAGGGLLGPPPGTARSTESVSRASTGGLGGLVATFGLARDASVTVGLRGEHFRVDTVPTTDRSLALSVRTGRIALSGTIGTRVEPSMRSSFGTAAASLDVTSPATIVVSLGQYPANRLLGTAAGRFVTVGLSLRTGAGNAPASKAPDIPRARAGWTRLVLDARSASRVEVAGDFNDWKPIDAARAPNGVWYVDLRIPPGQYRYAFRVNGGAWTVPDGTTAVDDGFGGRSAWLTVSQSPNTAPR